MLSPLVSIMADRPPVSVFRTPMVRWRQPLGDGFFLTGVFEDPDSEITATDGTNFSTADSENRWPDFILAGSAEGEDWHIKLSSILRDLKTRKDGAFSEENALVCVNK